MCELNFKDCSKIHIFLPFEDSIDRMNLYANEV